MSKSLKKLIDINRLREFKNKLVGTGSAYVQTGAVDQTIAGTKTFSKPIAGSVTGSSGSCTGNAATATQFSANATVALTGDATGTSAGSKKGWSVPVTLANSGVTAGSYGPTADVTGNNNATISVPQITVDAKGRVTSVTNRTLTCKNNTYNVYNKTLTIQKNGTNVATFTSNSNTDVTANITVPTKTSELANDSGFLTSHQSLSNYVTLNGAQTISGAKTFSGLTKTAGKTEQRPPSDLNDALYNVESYSWGTSTTNKPSSSYGILLNLNREGNVHSSTSSGWRAQLGVGTDTRLYLRTKTNTGGEWSAWKEFLTSHQSLSNYSTLANTVKSLSISGKTITVTPGSGSAYTLTTQDTVYTHPTTSGNKHVPSGGSSGQFLGWASDGTAKWVNNPNTNTDTLMTQNVSTTNATYPVLLVATADATANQGAKTGIFAKSVKVNPSTNVISASGFSGPLTGNVTGNCSGSSGSCTGNAATATKLAAKRTINGIAFDGTANITIPVAVPAGVIIPFAGTSVPTGYLLCNGAAVSRTDYANLFAAIGTLYGVGDGSTTFNLPDARDRVLQGASGTHSVGSYIAAGLPNITGNIGAFSRLGDDVISGAFGPAFIPAQGAAIQGTASSGIGCDSVGFNASRSSSYYGASTKPQVDAIATNFIIKY